MKPIEFRIHHFYTIDTLIPIDSFGKEFCSSPAERPIKLTDKPDGKCKSCEKYPLNPISWLKPSTICNLAKIKQYDQIVLLHLQQYLAEQDIDIDQLTVGLFSEKPWLPLQAFLYLADQEEVVNFGK